MKSAIKFLKHCLSLLIVILLLSSFSALAQDTYPSPTVYKYLNDYVGIIDNEDANKMGF